MEIYWHLRIAWWLLLGSALTPVEVVSRSGGEGWSSGGSLWEIGGHRSGSAPSKNRDHKDSETIKHFTQSDIGSKPADYHQQPPYIANHPSHPGSFSAGGGDYSRQRFGHNLRRMSPPGYKSSYSVMPGLFDRNGGRGRLHFSSYRSTPFGYSKNFFVPSIPTVTSLPLTHYHYPSSIPPKTMWGCECYVEDKTAVCTYKLEDELVPSCVDSSVTAVFIQSQEVEWLSADAFRHVPNLEYINITDTTIGLLPRNIFIYTQDLRHLVVQKNHDLRSLDNDVFRGAIKLEDVILDRNDISSLDRDVFTHLTNMKRLNLAYNKIRSLPEGIFRNNRELQELVLSGNPLRISSDIARGLLASNAKLRVLLMRNCKLEELPTGLLSNTSNLEWLDLSHNKLSKFPLQFTADCTKLAYLGLAYNKLQVLDSEMIQQRGGSLDVMDLEGNPWHCDCDILPLAAWTALRKDAVPGRSKCSSPKNAEKVPLQRWFHSRGAKECDRITSSLRTDLNRVLSVARAIATKDPTFFANLLRISDDEVSFAATNYFLYAAAARSDADIASVVWHWARFLEKVLDRRHLRRADLLDKSGVSLILLDRLELLRIKVDEDFLNLDLDFQMDPLATTTTKPPAARPIGHPLRCKGFEPLVNFTYVMNNVPENLTKAVDDGIEEELKILFGVIDGTNAASLNTTPDHDKAFYSTGVKKLNAMEQLVAGLRSELRELLSTLLLSIDRASWDAAEQEFIEKEEKKARRSQKPPQQPAQPVYTRRGVSSAGNCLLAQPRLTVIVAVLTLLARTLS